MATRTAKAPTTAQMLNDSLSKLAVTNWSPKALSSDVPFNYDVVDTVFKKELLGSDFNIRRIMLLEFSQYLENYLWPNYSPERSTPEYVISIVCMVNEKYREAVPAWEPFKTKPEQFEHLFKQIMDMTLDENMSLQQRTVLIIFMDHCYNSLEIDVVRSQVQRTVSLAMWENLMPSRLQQELKKSGKLRKAWKSIMKKDAKLDEEVKKRNTFDRGFLQTAMNKFCSMIAAKEFDQPTVDYCHRFLDLVIDLDSCLPTRRWFNTVLTDTHLVVRCMKSSLFEKDDVFTQLVKTLQMYTSFEVNDLTGEPLSKQEMMSAHYERMSHFQRCAFSKFSKLRNFALGSVAQLDQRKPLEKWLQDLDMEELLELCEELNIKTTGTDDQDTVLEMIVSFHERRPSQLDAINESPLYPTEQVLWDENLTKTDHFNMDSCLALPKLNLQFLTLHDYLLRNFNLFRLESAYEIRQDVEDAVYRTKAWKSEDGGCIFKGWARMALPIQAFNVVEVAKPNIGESHPSQVRADVTITTNIPRNTREEWENLRKHDICFLLAVQPLKNDPNMSKRSKIPFTERFNVLVRGCEVEGMLDDDGHVIEEGPEPKPKIQGLNRTFRVWLDTNQYQSDMESVVKEGHPDPYESLNLIVRRKPKENNFKAVLATIRGLMNTQCVVPDWLHDVLLGYGDPSAANYSKMGQQIKELDWNDTFLSISHLKESFPDHKIDTEEAVSPPFKLTFDKEDTNIVVRSHVIPNRGPYIRNAPRKNAIHFTPTQTEAIRSGMQPGLTMVVGPPGTGKTDVAVQIISNLYHNFPEQRTLIVTHSNQALNQLFEKIMQLDIDERHLLRLGHGEEQLETEKDFSRYGRVNFVLAKRIELLEEVGKLQSSLGVPGDVSYTCETACHFFLYQVLSRWEKYERSVVQSKSIDIVGSEFPFSDFFSDAQPLFKGNNFEQNWEISKGCFRYIRNIFTQLEEFRAFELLRSGLDRSRYLLVKSAKIIAMTCTHAALKRQDLTELGFKYDNILMEESAQILEIETFIPLLLQNPMDGYNRLKRWIMIGDHHQLPPVIKNLAFQKFSNMEQSLFARLVRLGVPTVQLDAQGRARPSICDLYRWRYKKLGDLPHIMKNNEYQSFNPGLVFDFQLINVEDYMGVGESEPNPYFYQNLAEAEYCVSLFMYMRLLGYSPDEITILTTYNGQKHLIRDVVRQRCGNNPLIGWPNKITTVDRFQGQQNNYIILSLVRTKHVGHIRDVRRLVVAMSRARLGLYVFARVSLFSNCFELSPAFRQLMSRPLNLGIVTGEKYPPKMLRSPGNSHLTMTDMTHMHRYVYDMYIDIARDMNLKQPVQQQQLEKPPPEDKKAKADEQKAVPIEFEVKPPEVLMQMEEGEIVEGSSETVTEDPKPHSDEEPDAKRIKTIKTKDAEKSVDEVKATEKESTDQNVQVEMEEGEIEQT
uniref:RNA helicase aquarius n=1 Tax=Ciona intestinalis TaxID=7719 RepID=UPI000180C6B0|nr:RNA helicase aquarius [Ciona intestinalis]|eukprot:XP_002131605.1 RNA helicase aquarius [Ciona intestinalis]